MKEMIKWLRDEESGQGMVEYGLILALIAVAVIGVLVLMKGKLKTIFESANTGLDTATGAASASTGG